MSKFAHTFHKALQVPGIVPEKVAQEILAAPHAYLAAAAGAEIPEGASQEAVAFVANMRRLARSKRVDGSKVIQTMQLYDSDMTGELHRFMDHCNYLEWVPYDVYKFLFLINALNPDALSRFPRAVRYLYHGKGHTTPRIQDITYCIQNLPNHVHGERHYKTFCDSILDAHNRAHGQILSKYFVAQFEFGKAVSLWKHLGWPLRRKTMFRLANARHRYLMDHSVISMVLNKLFLQAYYPASV